jgi:hypothetical protein
MSTGDGNLEGQSDLINPPLSPELKLKERELTLAENRLRQERELKEAELAIQRRQLAVGRWTGPVAVAVVAGSVGIIGSFISSAQNRELERRKQEGTLVLEAIRTAGPNGAEREKQAAANLAFLAKAGLIHLDKKQLEEVTSRGGDGIPSLPPQAGPGIIPEPVRQRIEQSFDAFAEFFRKLGANDTAKVRVEPTPLDSGMLAYYDPDKRTVYIDRDRLSDPNLPLREYAHAVLYSDQNLGSEHDVEKAWVYHAIESGLASYFGCSFVNNPRVPGGDGTLDNDASVAELQLGFSNEFLFAWGGTFWDLRKTIGATAADRLLYRAWATVTPVDVAKNAPRDFLAKVLEADKQLEQGKYAAQIAAAFERHGVR